MVVSVDFDGTCVTHEFPDVGKPIGAEIVLKHLIEKGCDIILLTMRSKEQNIAKDGNNTLDEAVAWFKDNGIKLYGINENPSQESWSKSRKVYANVYIDDQFLGCPTLVYNGKNFVDWYRVVELLQEKNIFNGNDVAELQEKLKKKYKFFSHIHNK